jgi:aryl-alcohol dehydrogenase-like predicted oxidoreductase
MEKHKLGTSDLEITSIGIGTWAIGGGGWEFAWGAQDDNDSIAAIREGLDLGINWIDTAAVYGLGHAEEIVARALEGRRERPYIFTKCGMIWDRRGKVSNFLKAGSIRAECEQSLRRLRVETIDLYQIHWPRPDEDIEEAWIELAKLQEQGKVRHIGVSNFDVSQMRRALDIAPIASLQPPYSLLARQAESEILPFARRGRIGVIAYSPLFSGLLSGNMTRERVARLPQDDWRRHNRNFQEPLLSHNLRLVELLREIGFRHGLTAAEVAIAWTLNNPAVTGSIVGVRRPQQLADIIGGAELRLDADELREIVQAQEVEAGALSLFSA